VKRSTAIGHLVETGEVSSEHLRFRDTDIGWPVEELWVTGDLLGLADTVDAGSVVLVLDVPPDEAPWLAINHAGEWAGDTAIDALRTGRLDCLDVVEPTASELTGQLLAELRVSRGHLRTVVERYWDRDWRRENKGYDESPEDHLWRAAAAVSEMQDALDELAT
jgi:hypothetical protein